MERSECAMGNLRCSFKLNICIHVIFNYYKYANTSHPIIKTHKKYILRFPTIRNLYLRNVVVYFKSFI